MRIVGCDPGSHICGYGVLEVEKRTPRLLECGVIDAGKGTIGARLETLYDGLLAVIDEYHPSMMAIEEVHSKSAWAKSGLVLSEARGVLLLAATKRHVPTFHYAPSVVKLAVSGSGSAKKERVRRFVEQTLGIDLQEQPLDVSDALAIALCHVYRNDVRRVA